jgi:polyphosphate kinase
VTVPNNQRPLHLRPRSSPEAAEPLPPFDPAPQAAPSAEAAPELVLRRPPPLAVPTAVVTRPVPPDASLDDPSLYLNRELSWLDFNWRVLSMAMDDRMPLLERVRFVAIAESNLDEFCAKRVGALQRYREQEGGTISPDGFYPDEQLRLILSAMRVMHHAMHRLWEETLRPALAAAGIVVVSSYDELSPADQLEAEQYFRANVYPILTPLAWGPGHPFPFISSQSLSAAVLLVDPARRTRHFARVKIPTQRKRWIPVGSAVRYLPIDRLIVRHMAELFPGMRIEGVHLFRVTRSVDIERDDEEVEDLLQMISEELRARRFAPVVRLEIAADMPEDVRELLREELSLEEAEIVPVEGLLDLTGLFALADLPHPALRFEHWEPVTPARVANAQGEDRGALFEIIRSGDILVHHPHESFVATTLAFIEAAAADPRVLAIKQTLYRTNENSPVIQALIRAAEAGKQVAVLVEVTARLDEAKNISWARSLERAGVHVTYGMVGLKTHAKAVLVVREEADGIRTYCHLGTGNYHVNTARLYTDLGLLTTDPEIGRDVINLFHFLTGYAPDQRYSQLLVAPRDLRGALEQLVDNEIDAHGARGDGRIILKMNAIDDVAMIRKLYEASRAGVRIDLIVRGHTRLRPGVPGVSDNIRLISVLGRFLEHDRIFYFHNGGHPRIYIGSADWRRRNLEERVEAVAPIRDALLAARLLGILLRALADNRFVWELQSDGSFQRRHPAPGQPEQSFQHDLMRDAIERSTRGDLHWKTTADEG